MRFSTFNRQGGCRTVVEIAGLRPAAAVTVVGSARTRPHPAAVLILLVVAISTRLIPARRAAEYRPDRCAALRMKPKNELNFSAGSCVYAHVVTAQE
jgi:hypothetical protein